MMRDANALWLPALLVAVAIGVTTWRYYTARSIAERWLMQHRYRARSLRIGWFSFTRFSPKLFRNERNAFEFRAEVEDLSLGGTGVLWLRVWTDWIGLSEREPEVTWDRMPTRVERSGGTFEERLEEQLLDLLARVAAGESIFRAPGSSVDDGGAFDELVEHVLALSRRGLVTCDTPLASMRGPGQYAAIANVALTERGERHLEQFRTSR